MDFELFFKGMAKEKCDVCVYEMVIMPPKSSAMSKTASSVPKSPLKTRRSTRKRAQSSTPATAEPPVKKIAPSAEEDEEVSTSRSKRGKARRGKAIRCVTG